jgi:hypothetical protein
MEKFIVVVFFDWKKIEKLNHKVFQKSGAALFWEWQK